VLQEGEISADLFTFHEAVSQLQLLEEEVLDSHTSLAQMIPQWMELDRALLAMTNDVDYDQDGEICSSCNHHSSKKKVA
jgi:kinesin family protein 2/24